MNSCGYCFMAGFLIDKISLFPFILGCGAGIFLTKNTELYNYIKVPVTQTYEYLSHVLKKD